MHLVAKVFILFYECKLFFKTKSVLCSVLSPSSSWNIFIQTSQARVLGKFSPKGKSLTITSEITTCLSLWYIHIVDLTMLYISFIFLRNVIFLFGFSFCTCSDLNEERKLQILKNLPFWYFSSKFSYSGSLILSMHQSVKNLLW